MVGIPYKLGTKADFFNAFDYVKETGVGKATLRSRLLSLKHHTTILVLKKTSAKKNSDEQTPEDFEAVDDPNAEKIRLGFSDAEIEQLLGGLA